LHEIASQMIKGDREINKKIILLENYFDVEKEHQREKEYYVKRDHDKSYKR
jgi:hypothetical protein